MHEIEPRKSSNNMHEIEPRRSKRQRIEKNFGHDFLSTVLVERPYDIDNQFACIYLIDEDPKTY